MTYVLNFDCSTSSEKRSSSSIQNYFVLSQTRGVAKVMAGLKKRTKSSFIIDSHNFCYTASLKKDEVVLNRARRALFRAGLTVKNSDDCHKL